MSSKRWIPHSYNSNKIIPLINEIILLRYAMSVLDFALGPHLKPSNHSQESTSPFIEERKPLHYAWVSDVEYDKQNKKFRLSVMPILSYSTRPHGCLGPWDPSKWMADASENSRLYHIPVPAADWEPPKNPSPKAPTLAFDRDWVFSRPSWLLMTEVKVYLDYEDLWYRHPANHPLFFKVQCAMGIVKFQNELQHSSSISKRDESNNASTDWSRVLPCHQSEYLSPEYYENWLGNLDDPNRPATDEEIRRIRQGINDVYVDLVSAEVYDIIRGLHCQEQPKAADIARWASDIMFNPEGNRSCLGSTIDVGRNSPVDELQKGGVITRGSLRRVK